MNEPLSSLSGPSPADGKAFGISFGRIAIIVALDWIPYPHLTPYAGRPKKGDAHALGVLAQMRPAARK